MTTSVKKSHAIIVSFLLLGHLALMVSAARSLTPTWDEINYPASGAVALATGSLAFYPYNPFLARLCAGIPALLLTPGGPTTLKSLSLSPAASGTGYQWLYHTVKDPALALWATRLPAILFSVAAALLLFHLALSLWGIAGAYISLLTYFSIPIFLSRGSLALLEMPMYTFMLAALVSHYKWTQRPRVALLAATGAFTALAALCKFLAFPLAGVFLICVILNGEGRIRNSAVMMGSFLLVFLAGFLLWSGGADSLHSCWRDLFGFNLRFPFYWRGVYRENASSFISWAAFAVKMPPVPVALFVWSLSLSTEKGGWSRLKPYWLLILAYGAMPLVFSAPASTVQLSPLYLGLVVTVGALGAIWDRQEMRAKVLLAALLSVGLIDVVRVHPNYLSYFNNFSGGPKLGEYWLSDSDQDWGQSIPSLANELHRRQPGLVVLSYSGAADPEAHGVHYLDLISAALVSHEHKNPPLPEHGTGPVYLAVGTKMVQIAPEFFDWLNTHRRPLVLIDSTIRFYEISHDAEALRWLSERFQSLHRATEAAWFNAEAGRASSTPPHP